MSCSKLFAKMSNPRNIKHDFCHKNHNISSKFYVSAHSLFKSAK